MAGFRQEKINDEVRKELSLILRSVKDPRVSESFINVTQADVAGDLAVAKIYYSVLGTEKPGDGVAEGLNSANGYIRRELAKRLNLRKTPKLIFIRDDSTERAINISEILKEIL